jgi:predicted O-methyltransferase YrrM
LHPLTVARTAVREHGALQKEGELAGLLAILADAQPQIIVEIGCDAGGTLFAWRQLNPYRLIGIELPKAGFHSGKPLNRFGAEVIIGDSHEQATFDALTGLLDGELVDFLFIDGDHTYEGVKRDFEMYSPLVRPDGLIVFHDICPHPGQPDVGVDMLWRQLGKGAVKDEIIVDPPTWGGVGVLRQRTLEAVA